MGTAAGRSQASPKRVRLVVVHGIGSQKVGSTASRWADALVRFARAAGYEPGVATAALTSDPAKVTVTFPVVYPFRPPPVAAVDIEEAYWADSFAAPTVGRVLRFLLTVAPVLAITQSIAVWRTRDQLWSAGSWQKTQAAGRTATQVAPLALAILALGVAAPLIAVLLLVLLLASSLPIPSVRQAVGKALGWLTTTIGDAYLFVADPVNRAAMESRLAASLAPTTTPPATSPAVSPPGDQTVVLAHSQGAALAYRALCDLPEDERPAALITVGSGVGRLRQVGLLQTIPWYVTPLFVVIAATTAGAIALWDALSWLLLLIASVATVAVWLICRAWLTRAEGAGGQLLDPIPRVSWLDIWASFDLVANGPSAEDDGETTDYQSARVAGEQSLIRDHVRYELDWDQTMPLVFRRVLDPSGTARISYVGVRTPDPDDSGRTREQRTPLAGRDRTGLLLRTVPLAVAVIVATQVDLFGLGHWLRTAAPGFLDSTVDGVFAPLRTVSEFLDATWIWVPRPQELLGCLALLGLGAAGSIASRRVLTFFQRRETTAWLAGGGLSDAGGPRWGDDRWGNTTWGRARWPLALGLVAIVASVVPLFLGWSAGNVHWTREQTVRAYLTALAEDDTAALCEVSTESVTTRTVPDGDGSRDVDIDVCGTEHEDELRTCSDARDAVGALPEDGIRFEGNRVRIAWDPETPPECENAAHWLPLPVAVGRGEDGTGRWQVTDAVDRPSG